LFYVSLFYFGQRTQDVLADHATVVSAVMLI